MRTIRTTTTESNILLSVSSETKINKVISAGCHIYFKTGNKCYMEDTIKKTGPSHRPGFYD